MRMSNVRFTAFAHYTDGTQKMRMFVTEEALSRWANAQYRKDEGVTVVVYNGADGLLNDDIYCTYHE